MSIIIVGVDPGKGGAIAFVACDRDKPYRLQEVLDMPVVAKRVSAPGLADIFRVRRVDFLWQEMLSVRPMEGAGGALSFGRGGGLIEAVCAMAGIPYQEISAAAWKKAMRCPADKGRSRLLAQRLFPEKASLFARVKDDGRAEAVLIALYGVKKHHEN